MIVRVISSEGMMLLNVGSHGPRGASTDATPPAVVTGAGVPPRWATVGDPLAVPFAPTVSVESVAIAFRGSTLIRFAPLAPNPPTGPVGFRPDACWFLFLTLRAKIGGSSRALLRPGRGMDGIEVGAGVEPDDESPPFIATSSRVVSGAGEAEDETGASALPQRSIEVRGVGVWSSRGAREPGKCCGLSRDAGRLWSLVEGGGLVLETGEVEGRLL